MFQTSQAQNLILERGTPSVVNKKSISREVGLEIGSICCKYFLKSKHLHYGYWPEDLEVDVANVKAAQENYADFLIGHIPEETKTILDVGCGSGLFAKKLTDLGYQVDCVCPSPYLAQDARELLPDTANIFECYYEKLQTDNRYDLVMFCESFQYIDMKEGFKKTLGIVNANGHMLICDIFRNEALGKSPLSGGHRLSNFYKLVSGTPLDLVEDLDITDQTAPSIELMDDMVKEVVHPIVKLVLQFVDIRHPLVAKVIRLRYRKAINKVKKKYVDSERNGEAFRQFKSYRLLLYRLC